MLVSPRGHISADSPNLGGWEQRGRMLSGGEEVRGRGDGKTVPNIISAWALLHVSSMGVI